MRVAEESRQNCISTFQALHLPFPPPSLFVLFLTSSLILSLSFGSVGFPFDDGILTSRILRRSMWYVIAQLNYRILKKQ
jgi:hypothetical protein